MADLRKEGFLGFRGVNGNSSDLHGGGGVDGKEFFLIRGV
jgi:hypothetical protein